MKVCEKCGFDRIIKTYHDRPDDIDKVDIYLHCPKCKNEVYVGIEDGCVHIEPEFTLFIEAKQNVELTKIIGVLRKIDPSLSKVSLSIFKQKLISEGVYILNNLSRNELEKAKSVLIRNEIRYVVK